MSSWCERCCHCCSRRHHVPCLRAWGWWWSCCPRRPSPRPSLHIVQNFLGHLRLRMIIIKFDIFCVFWLYIPRTNDFHILGCYAQRKRKRGDQPKLSALIIFGTLRNTQSRAKSRCARNCKLAHFSVKSKMRSGSLGECSYLKNEVKQMFIVVISGVKWAWM